MTTPTEPGYYWAKIGQDWDWRVVEVISTALGLRVLMFAEGSYLRQLDHFYEFGAKIERKEEPKVCHRCQKPREQWSPGLQADLHEHDFCCIGCFIDYWGRPLR